MKKFKAVILIFLLLTTLTMLNGCAAGEPSDITAPTLTTWEKAIEIMAQDDIIILDVRTPAEFEAGHIPGAVNVPLNELSTAVNYLIADINQVILVYCRSGNRSTEALGFLVNMGYTNVFDAGGILDWPGEIVNQGETG